MRAAVFMVLAALSGCASAPPQPPAVASTATSSQPARAFDRNAPPRVETPTFAVELTAPDRASSAQPAPIELTIERRGDFHINLEYPLRIELGASDGATLIKSTLAAADARELSEERARFETGARFAGAGRHWLAARVQFAVCTPDTCVPSEQSLAVSIDVQ